MTKGLIMLAFAGFASLALNGCYSTERSGIRHEDAVVASKYYTAPTVHFSKVGKVSVMTFSPSRHDISFNGEIELNVDNDTVYERFKKVGDSADVSYRELFKIKIRKIGNHERDTTRSHLGYEFVDAVPHTDN